MIDGLAIDPAEIDAQAYGASTAAAVLAFKTARAILGPGRLPRQHRREADRGSIDAELVPKQSDLGGTPQDYCGTDGAALA